MKLSGCILVSTALVSVCSASSFDFGIPELSYKATAPLSQSSSVDLVAPQLPRLPSLVTVVPRSRAEWRPGRNGFATMPVISPKAGVDYKLTIVEADPAIDPHMLVPALQGSAKTPSRRGKAK